MIGKKILNYEIKSLIGEGGMGNVYLGEHTSIGRKVAIKSLRPELANNEEIKSRFKNEASVMAKLQHQNIVGLIDYVDNEDGLFLIMEYVEGKGLNDILNALQQPMSIERSIKLMKQILSAFAYAHESGIVHRDVKPENILIKENDEVKVLDFGIAKLVGDSQFNLTKTGTQVGTVYYMSPEQVKAKDVDHRSDIYSLGITFYEIVSGFCPYKTLKSEYDVYDKIVREPLISLVDSMGDEFSDVWQVIQKATEKDPENRFQSCEEFISAFGSPPKSKKKRKVKNNKEKSVKRINNGFATAALILGILAFLLSCVPIIGFIVSILAIVNGTRGKKKALEHEELKDTRSRASTGKGFGVFALIINILATGGLIFFFFILDSDSDGVVDYWDKCPYEAGTDKGCPEDSDNDGVPDAEDNCPDLAGSFSHNGCPDSDDDGVYDDIDKCPEEYGEVENNGCPLSDRDGDGIADVDDECPDTPGVSSNGGCPIEIQVVCPYCNNVSLEGKKDVWMTCMNCYERFFTCERVSNGQIGIRTNWFNDGECDCTGCEDEGGANTESTSNPYGEAH